MLALLKLFGVRDWVIVALAIALGGAVLHSRYETARADRAVADAQSWKSRHDVLVSDLKAAQELADRKQQEHERELQQRVDDARVQISAAAKVNEARLRAAVAAERADALSLRDQLAIRFSCPVPPARNPVAAGDDPTAALGDVLAEALRLQAELAGAAEGHAAEVRSLLDAWPR